MIFTSFNFLIFFPVFIAVFFLTPEKYRWITLLTGSYFFYFCMKPIFLLLVAAITLSTYYFTRKIDSVDDEAIKKKYMIINIVLLLMPLFVFKYLADLNQYIISILGNYSLNWMFPEIELLLPVGISFYTFMAIGYTIDVFNEEIESEKSLGKVALFISFFPLILSGPIERAGNIFPQLNGKLKYNQLNLSTGLKMMIWGYFLKLVIADRLGLYIDTVYGNIKHHNGTTLAFTALMYPFQVYADLGGYSLIAIGVSRIMGIKVISNFKRPFFARTMSDFWRRWHISLITWLTDYVYTPLSFAFRKHGKWGIVIALMITFAISGIWHGASITFIVWGLIQGIYLSIEALTLSKRSSIEKKFNLQKNVIYGLICIFITFVLFAFSQIFGRLHTIEDSLLVINKIMNEPGKLFFAVDVAPNIIYSVFGIIIMLSKDFIAEFHPEIRLFFNSRIKLFRMVSYGLVCVIILAIGVFDGSQFIYFKF